MSARSTQPVVHAHDLRRRLAAVRRELERQDRCVEALFEAHGVQTDASATAEGRAMRPLPHRATGLRA
ncbi:MAG: hypothetical protein KC543_01705 [Myxococcales bacterium]|nr:hypothetical protein [Myxococcales bacterium]